MSKRNQNRDERPRTARLRRRPSPDASYSDDDSLLANQPSVDHERKKNSLHNNGSVLRPRARNELLTSKMDNLRFAGAKSNALKVPQKSGNLLNSKSNFVPGQYGEPPKSPKILPKLQSKSPRLPRKSSPREETTDAASDILTLSPPGLLSSSVEKDGEENVGFGKHYSVLPDIAKENSEQGRRSNKLN